MWLPVAHRELIVASRRPILAWSRLVAPALGLLLISLLVSPSEPPSRIGRSVFTSVTLVLFLYATFAGLFFTAESISTERRDGTLPLLQVTGMRELDLIMGKLLGNSLPGIFGFIAATPLLALPLLLGGVTPLQIVQVALILLATLFLSLGVAIHASSATTSSTGALKQSLANTGIILACGIYGVIYFRILNRQRDPRQLTAPNELTAKAERSSERAVLALLILAIWALRLPSASPAAMLFEAFAGPYRLLSSIQVLEFYLFWAELLVLVGISLHFLRSARPFSHLVPSGPQGDFDGDFTAEPAPPAPSALTQTSRRLAKHIDPLQKRLAPHAGESLLLAGLGVTGAYLQFSATLPLYSGLNAEITLLAWLSFGVALVIFFLLARRAASFLVQSRRSGMLEVLLITPLPWQELLALHRSAFLRLAWRPLTIFMVGELVGYLLASRFSQSPDRFELALILVIVTVVSYVCATFATLWCSLLFALRSKTATRAAFWTVLLVLVLPALTPILVPFATQSPLDAGYFFAVLTGWIYIFFNSILWAACRLRLKILGARAPAEILRLSRG